MTETKRFRLRARTRILAITTVGALVGAFNASPQDFHKHEDSVFWPGNLVVSRSVYDNRAANVKQGTVLPPNCADTMGGCSASTGAPDDGTYPTVWNNAVYDGSFGITSKIFLDQITTSGYLLNSIEVRNSSEPWVKPSSNQLVTSFSSKSEIALHLSTDHKNLTFMGYVAPIDALDVSNSNTPGAVDLTNPVGESYYRAVAQVGPDGKFRFTETNAYSGNNGRSAILNSGANVYYTAGNAGNGASPQPDNVILGAGAQIIFPVHEPERDQTPGTPTPVASFSVTELGSKADKIGKDDNFRGLAIHHNVIYYSKGSGSNGVNTVYFVDTTGKACPNGVGLPSPSAELPASPLPYEVNELQTTGLPNNMCILAGFPAVPNKTVTTTAYPFGLWFADDSTLYVADEGDGYTGGTDLYTHAAAQTTAGLQKWVFDSTSNVWKLAYTLQTGLKLGSLYTVTGYPSGTNAATGLPWAPAADGLRNLTGRVDDRWVTLWAITSTVSGNGDTGADPNKLVMIVDSLKNTDAATAAGEEFHTVAKAGFAEVLRGISFTPGSDSRCGDN